ncbi:MAG: outer membrane protein assembly factor BamB family protein [Armatimonadota bacterium]
MGSLSRLGINSAILLVMAAALVAAPWTGGRGPGNRGAFPDTPFPKAPAVVWKAYLGENFVDLPVSNTLVAAKNAIVAYGNHLLAVSTETGEARWQHDFADTPLDDLLYLDDQIIVTFASGLIEAYSPVNGSFIWRHKCSGGLRNGPVYNDTMLFVNTKSRNMEIIERKTGKRLGSLATGDNIEGGPVLFGKYLVLVYADGTSVKLEDGVTRWSAEIPHSVISLTPVTNGRVVIVNTTNSLFALNPNDQRAPIRWTYPCAQRLHEPTTLDGDRIFLATRNGRLHALDVNTGKELWANTAGKDASSIEQGIQLLAPPVGGPLVMGKQVVMRMQNGLLGLYTRDTGKLEWVYRLKAPVGAKVPTQLAAGKPAIDGDHVYFAGTDGNIYHLATGTPDFEAPDFRETMPQEPDKGFIDTASLQYIGAIIEDEGSGLQSTQVSIQLDRKDLTPNFDAKSGYYYAALPPTTKLEPGMHRLVMTAKDNRGNQGSMVKTFIIGTGSATDERIPVQITGEFVPKHLMVKRGTIISWTNKSGAPRTVLADLVDNGKEMFSSDILYPDGIPNGETWVWIVPADLEFGSYYYHCRLNGKAGNNETIGTGLVGVIEVVREYPQPTTTMPGGPGVGPGPGMPPGPGMNPPPPPPPPVR